jgi:hypothetical protein
MHARRTRRAAVVVLAVVACLLLGDDCDVDRDAVRERLAREAAERDTGPSVAVSPNACVTLPEPMPVGLSLVTGATDRVLVANSEPAAVIPLNIATQPPSVATPGTVPTIPDDSNGDGDDDDPKPKLEGIVGDDPTVPAGLALATSTAKEQVLFVSPTTATLIPLTVDGMSRTALSTAVAVTPGDEAVDSHGMDVTEPFTTNFTSGVAVSGTHVFVSTSNVADGAGTEDPVYRPGTVLVYTVDDTVFPPTIPDSTPQIISTTRYNPTDVTPYTSPGMRSFVLVTSTGALGVASETLLVHSANATDAGKAGAIEVIEVFAGIDDPALVAVIPLGNSAPGFGKVTLDRKGWIGTIGSLVQRRVLAVDLSVLDELPTEPPDEPVILDGSGDETDPVIDAPSLSIPAIGGGPPAETCAGTVVATAWADGDRLLALEFCDGTVSSWKVVLNGNPKGNPNPFPPDRFSLRTVLRAVAPLVGAAPGQLQAPLGMVVRPGKPGVSFVGPDVFLLVGLPEGALCGLASDVL